MQQFASNPNVFRTPSPLCGPDCSRRTQSQQRPKTRGFGQCRLRPRAPLRTRHLEVVFGNRLRAPGRFSSKPATQFRGDSVSLLGKFDCPFKSESAEPMNPSLFGEKHHPIILQGWTQSRGQTSPVFVTTISRLWAFATASLRESFFAAPDVPPSDGREKGPPECASSLGFDSPSNQPYG